MNDFIIVTDEAAFSCTPQLIKEFSVADERRLINSASILDRVQRTTLLINPERINLIPTVNESLGNSGPFKTAITIYSIVEKKKKIVFAELDQMIFPSRFVGGTTPNSAIPECYSGHLCLLGKKTPFYYETTLAWSSNRLVECGLPKITFIIFAVYDLNNMIISEGFAGSTPLPVVELSTLGKDKNINGTWLENSTTQRPYADSSIYATMRVEGECEFAFPLMSNVYADLKICTGRKDLSIQGANMSEESFFALSLLSFIFSAPNSDLMHVQVSESGNSYVDKPNLLCKLYSWDKDSLVYTPTLDRDELKDYVSKNYIKKFSTDIIKSILEARDKSSSPST